MLGVYISSACAGLPTSRLPASSLGFMAGGSVRLATTAEVFPDWPSSWTAFSDAGSSGWIVTSGLAFVPSSGGPDSLTSGGKGSDWTTEVPASSGVGTEEAGSVRMFLEMTGRRKCWFVLFFGFICH